MVKQYSEDFKKKAVSLLSKLRSEKFVMIDKKKVENVRDLIKELGITPYSIYKWKKEIKPEEPKAKDKKKRKKEKKSLRELIPPEISPEDKTIELMNIGRELTLKELEASGIFVIDVFGGRFVGSIAQAMKISGYSRMNLKELLYRVGKMYINKSGRGKKIK